MSSPTRKTALTDEENVWMVPVKKPETGHSVEDAYRLLAGLPLEEPEAVKAEE